MSPVPHGPIARRLLPKGVDIEALPLLAARALRAIGDGYMAVLLPAYLLAIGLDTLQAGIVSTATILGSAFTTLAVAAWAHRLAANRLLRAAAYCFIRSVDLPRESSTPMASRGDRPR